LSQAADLLTVASAVLPATQLSPSAGEGVKFKSSLHRAAIVLAGAVLGLAGVAAVAGPASARTPNVDVTGSTACVNGKNVVTWTLTNYWVALRSAKVDNLVLPPGEAPVQVGEPNATLKNGTVLLPATLRNPYEIQFTQVVDLAPTATISFDAVWPALRDPIVDSNTATVTLIQDCTPPKPKCVDADHATFNHTFAVDKVGGTTIINLDDDVNLCEGVEVPVTSVSYYAPKPQFDVPQYLYDKDSGKLTNDQRSLKLWVKTPPCYTQVDTFFGTENDIIPTVTANGPRYGDKKLGSPGAPGNRSKGPQAWYNGGDKSCVTPASTSVPSCDGIQAINLSNDGKYDETFTVKYGDQVKTVTVGAGKGETVNVPAGAGTVTVSAEGMETQTYVWTAPKDCALPSVDLVNTCTDVTVTVTNPEGVIPAKATVTYGKDSKDLTVAAGTSEKATFAAGTATSATVKLAGLDKDLEIALKKLVCTTPTATPTATTGGGSGGGSGNGTGSNGGGTLPITGAAAGGVAAGAAVLLIAGGVLFFVARRRKVRFTA
jgi:LPXTG-motif cell wall-anchored protein